MSTLSLLLATCSPRHRLQQELARANHLIQANEQVLARAIAELKEKERELLELRLLHNNTAEALHAATSKLRQTKRYLRQANKGAERNAMIARLLVQAQAIRRFTEDRK